MAESGQPPAKRARSTPPRTPLPAVRRVSVTPTAVNTSVDSDTSPFWHDVDFPDEPIGTRDAGRSTGSAVRSAGSADCAPACGFIARRVYDAYTEALAITSLYPWQERYVTALSNAVLLSCASADNRTLIWSRGVWQVSLGVRVEPE